MVASPLPDRDHRHLLQFYLAPAMDYGVRLAWAGLLVLIGFSIQLFAPPLSTLLLLAFSLPLLLAGTLFLLVRGYNLRPARSTRPGTWQKTTRDRFSRTRELEQEVKNWDESFTDLTCASGVVALLIVLACVGVIWLWLTRHVATAYWGPIFLADAAVLLLPHWITGTRSGWRPVALRQQIEALELAVAAIDKFDTPPRQIQPMFEMAGEGNRQVPINARVFIRFPDGPDGLLGVQFQVALNNVQGTKFPYLYAVIVAQKDFGLLDHFYADVARQLTTRQETQKGLFSLLKGSKESRLLVESSREQEVEVIVIRQRTTKTSGYHTEPAAIRRIALAAWRGVERILRTK